MKVLFYLSVVLFLSSCAKFAGTDIGVFSEGLWVIPTLTAVGAGIFWWLTYREWKEGGTGGWVGFPGKWVEDNTRFPFYKASFFIYGVVLTLATIGIIIGINGSR